MIACEHRRSIRGFPGHTTVPRCVLTGGLCADAEHGHWYDDVRWKHRGCVGTTGEWGAWRSFVGQLREYDGTVESRRGQWFVYWPRTMDPSRFMTDWRAWGSPICHYAATGFEP